MKVSQIGPFPPPRGGVETHIMRLKEYLQDEGIIVSVYDFDKATTTSTNSIKRKIDKMIWLANFYFKRKEDLIHVHWLSWRDMAYICLICKIRHIKSVFTFHSLRYKWNRMSMLNKTFARFVLKNANHIISVGGNEKEKLFEFYDCSERLTVLPAFIMPKIRRTKLPDYMTDFLNNHKVIISANGSTTDFYNGQDLYGIDMCLDLCALLKDSYDVGFVFCLTCITNPRYFEELKRRITDLEISDSFLLVTEDMEFWPVLEKSHVFVRPTNTDSYGVSIAEAVSLGVPSVASDVCKRPDGTILFQSRNMEDFGNKVRGVIEDYDQHKRLLYNVEKIDDCAEEILKIYYSLVNSL